MRVGLVCLLVIALGTACSEKSNTDQKIRPIDENNKKAITEGADPGPVDHGLSNNVPLAGDTIISAPVTGVPPGNSYAPVGAPPRRDEGAIEAHGWINTNVDHLSTFAADVDTGSYTLARAMLNKHQKPNADSIRVEEFLNYFSYHYQPPTNGDVFSVTLDSAPSPFSDDSVILRVGIKGKDYNEGTERKKINLVFLTDVSGSMSGPDRLDLAKSAMETLVNSLRPDDTIAIVTYASSSSVILPLTPISNRASVIDSIYSLHADGSTAMSDGIYLAYNEAEKGLSDDSLTRIVVLSDGDANVGNTSPEAILETIAEKVKKGIYLTTVGFGLGNYRDQMMEKLANKGNGNYYYVDNITEAKRVFQAEVTGTLDVIAKDLKIQVDFDPEKVSSYRLLGYENRDIADDDFRNDNVDAGELGPGHSVTALYEIKPEGAIQDNLAHVRLRYKNPHANDEVSEQEYTYLSQNHYESNEKTPRDFRLGVVAGSFAELLRASPYSGKANLADIEQELSSFIDENSGVELELLELMRKAQAILNH